MRFLNDWNARTTEMYYKLCGFHIDDTGYSLRQLFSIMYKDFIERFNFTTFDKTLDECVAYIEDENNGISDSDLFDYSVVDSEGLLLGKNLVYSITREYVGGHYMEKKVWHNVYLSKAQFSDSTLHRVASHLFLMAFPFVMYYPEFTITRRKYPKEVLNLKATTRIKDLYRSLDYCLAFDRPFLVRDLVKLMTDPKEATSMGKFMKISVYANGDIFIPCSHDGGNGHTIHLKSNDFIKKNWDDVVTRNVANIKKKDGGWFNGKQCDSPIWDYPLVELVKRLFFT